MLTRKQQALVTISGAAGSTPDPSGAKLVYATAFDVNPYQGDTVERSRLREYLGAYGQINASPYSTIQITVPLAGSGTAGTAPVFDALLRACGHSATEDTSSVVYAPVSANTESCDIFFIVDGQQHLISFAKGTAVVNLNAGQLPTIEFTMTGYYNHPTNPSSPTIPSVTQADEIPVNQTNTTMAVHGFAACGESLTLDVGNNVIHKDLINCEEIRITDRVSTGAVNIKAPDLATQDYFSAVESHEGVTAAAINATHGTTAGNIVELAAPATQLSTISVADSDGLVHYQMDIRYLPDAGDDEYALTFK